MIPPGPSPPTFRGLGEPPSAPRPEASLVALAADESVERWSASAAVALARSWASPERPVRLVDLSVWSPRLDGVLGLQPGEGATDVVLFGADSARVARPVGEGLEVVGAGTRVWDPARVMADGRLADLLAPPPDGLTAFLVPLELPGSERALQRAEAVVLLAPAHADAAFLLGDALARAVAWWGPGEGDAPEGESSPGAAAPVAGSRRPLTELDGGAGASAAAEANAGSPRPQARADAALLSPASPEDARRDSPAATPGRAPSRGETPAPADAGEAPGRAVEAAPYAPASVPPAAGQGAAPGSAPPEAPGPVVAGAAPVLLEPRGDDAPGGEGGEGVVAPTRQRGQAEGRWTILLAEDNDDHALLVQMSLRWASRKPVLLYRARNGDEAIRLLDGVTPDLLLLDLKMPGRTGLEVLEHVKGAEALRRIPVAVLTSSDRDEDVERAYGLGGNHYLTKPDDPRKLQQQLRTLLDNLWELRSIRRGRGVMEATGVTAVDPPAVVRHRAVSLALAAAVLLSLLVLAWSVGILG